MSSPHVDAVTGVLVCGDEVLVMQRAFALSAFPGYWAFPGGKVDAEDDAGPMPGACFSGLDGRLARALVRELHEELGYDLAAAAEAGEVIAIHTMGHVLTPPIAPVRFDTWFFRIDLHRKPDFEPDPREVATLGWCAPRELMARYAEGELLLAPPTSRLLAAMARELSITAFPPFQPPVAEADWIPMFEAVAGVRQLFVRSNTLPPADRTNAFLIGDAGSPRLLVDPSPANEAEYERLCRVLEQEGFDEVFLTHHHPDHRQYANRIAARFGKPLSASADTQVRIARREPDWFAGLAVQTRADGEIATLWLGHPVRVIAVPGHDEGQLALMPDNAAWCIVGDLIQGVGTVVIAAPEGDMAKYFATLEKVIALKPRVIYPSHGIALGGTHYLELTLAHRRTREAQLRELRMAGRTLDEMLAEVYRGIDPRLLPLARLNIESHLAKLDAEAA